VPERAFGRGVYLASPSREERRDMDQAQKLRDLASWYREFAERAENPAIWDARLRTAEDLEREAGNLETRARAALGKSVVAERLALSTRAGTVKSPDRPRLPAGQGFYFRLRSRYSARRAGSMNCDR
jgi:hypothetical protein